MSHPRHSIEGKDLTGISEKGIDLLEKLTVTFYDTKQDTPKSIMLYGDFCNCDDGWLCEHRIQIIIDYLKNEI